MFHFYDSIKNLLRKMTIQEPTFERIIVVYRYITLYGLSFPLAFFNSLIFRVDIDIVAYSNPNIIGGLAQKVSQIEGYL